MVLGPRRPRLESCLHKGFGMSFSLSNQGKIKVNSILFSGVVKRKFQTHDVLYSSLNYLCNINDHWRRVLLALILKAYN